MKLYNKIFESENLDFRKSAPSSRSEQVKASMGDWDNQEEINRDFKDLVVQELDNHVNIKSDRDGNKYIDLNHLSREAFKCTDFSDMFNLHDTGRAWNATTVDVSQWDVSRGKNFSYMFRYYESFNCDLSKWDVSQGRSFLGMFDGCYNFKSDLSKWDVSCGEDFDGMFRACRNFNSNLSKWDVSRGQDFHGMFVGCYNFNSDLSNWDVSRGENFIGMFYDCHNFNSDLSKWDVSNGVDFSLMLKNCWNFNSDLSNWDVLDKARTVGMFDVCPIEENFKPKKLQNI